MFNAWGIKYQRYILYLTAFNPTKSPLQFVYFIFAFNLSFVSNSLLFRSIKSRCPYTNWLHDPISGVSDSLSWAWQDTHFNLNYKPLQFTQQAKWHCSAERRSPLSQHLTGQTLPRPPAHTHTPYPMPWHALVKEVAQCLPAS